MYFSNTTGVTSGAGISNPSWTPEFTPVFSGVRVAQTLVFCEVFCRSLLAFFLFVVVLTVLQLTEGPGWLNELGRWI